MTITSSKKGQRLAIFACVLSLIMLFGVVGGSTFANKVYASSAKAQIGSTGYGSLADALSAANSGDTITMLADSTESYDFLIEKNVTIDLNGKTVTMNSTLFAYSIAVTEGAELTIADSVGSGKLVLKTSIGIYAAGGSVVLNGGTIENAAGNAISSCGGKVTVNGGAINVTKADSYGIYAFNQKNPEVTINDGSIVSAGYGVAFADCGGKFTMMGGSITADAFALSTNGSVKNSTEMKINGGTLSSSTIAVYLPSGMLSITDGTITGATGLYMKSGTLTISGGSISGTGAKADYKYMGNGADPTGDALVIDNCGYPHGAPVVQIIGGTFTSSSAKSVATYSYGSNSPITGFISGGKFSDPVAEENCAATYHPITNEDGSYGVSNLYTVSFDVSTVPAQSVVYGQCAVEPAAPSMDGYTFLGWYLGDTKFDFGTPITADIQLSAKWEKNAEQQPEPEHTFEEFINRMYSVALDREPDPVGKEFWMGKIANEGWSGGRVAIGFLVEAPEFLNRNLTDEQFLKVLYKTFFDRDPDEGGFVFWLNLMKNGGYSRADVVNGFVDSTEWCNLCAYYNVKSGAPRARAEVPSTNSIKFATRLYTYCFNREPDATGLNFWALRLTNLDCTGAEAARDFFFSQEYLNMNTTNEQYLTSLYRAFMGREPDADGYAFWMAHLTTDMDRMAVLRGFAQSQEFTNICNQYGIERGTV